MGHCGFKSPNSYEMLYDKSNTSITVFPKISNPIPEFQSRPGKIQTFLKKKKILMSMENHTGKEYKIALFYFSVEVKVRLVIPNY